mmetsp:Transcript_7982/g.27431  ORF Transcript_7982/g.27431 Transcript_7982/m.27431 type:complete len:109 (-) Transcript_7982:78-404(-)
MSIVGKKPANSRKMPYDSMMRPIIGQPQSTRAKPEKKAMLPLLDLFRLKKRTVALGPMIMVTPDKKKEVSHRQKAPVEEEQSSEEHEKHAEAREAQAYLSPVVQEHGA